MKVLAINGSPKANGNTYRSLNIIGERLKEYGVDMEIVQVGGMKFAGCIACGACFKVKNETCPAYKDQLGEIIAKAKEADGLLLGSPVYYAGLAGGMKSFLDRFFMVCGANGGLMRHKVGASIAAVRRSGGIPTVDQLNKYIEYSEMFMPTSNYWTVVHGEAPGEITEDLEGMQILETLGNNMGWLINAVNKADMPKPAQPVKQWTNFVR